MDKDIVQQMIEFIKAIANDDNWERRINYDIYCIILRYTWAIF